jgi:U32 family peptidase
MKAILLKLPELLSPAGSMEALRAGIENGADAVYLGGQSFSARASAANFSREELAEAVEYAHLRGVKVYVTANILIDNKELNEFTDYLYYLYSIGVDAVILQDMGVAYFAGKVLPELPLHASTQMTVTNSAGVEYLQELGFERIVLARETSLKDMQTIQEKTGAELEVFVHGALCICYSGQCLMSSMIGGRSGNRGRCAQPCRMAYKLVTREDRSEVSGIEVGEHLLSPRDLNLLDYLEELSDAGIYSLKVEGRMKRAEYVATVTRNYRQALDRIADSGGKGTEEEHKELAQIFNRDFTADYLLDSPGPELMSYKRPNNRGIMLGRVVHYDKNKNRVQVKLDAELNIGDGIEVWINKGREGVYVQKIWSNKEEVNSANPGEQVWIEIPGMVSIGDRIFKTHDEKLVAKARLSYQEGKALRRIPLVFQVTGKLNEPLQISAIDPEGNRGTGSTEVLAEEALKRPLTEEYLQQQLDRLGNTPFSLRSLQVQLEGNIMVPVREINEARRKAVEQLMLAKLDYGTRVSEVEFRQRVKEFKRIDKVPEKRRTRLAVTVGDTVSLEKAVRAGADVIYFGGEQFRAKPAFSKDELAKGIELCLSKDVVPVMQLPRLASEQRLGDYQRLQENAAASGVKAVQVGNLGSLKLALDMQQFEVYADYPLNVFNNFTLRFLTEQGVKLATLSPELNFEQIAKLNLGQNCAPEFLVHGALPLMITEYCAVGSLVGGGKREVCTHPCKHKGFGLKDRLNYVFPIETDQNCRMHIFNAKELNLLEHLGQFVGLGAGAVRLELKKEPAEYVNKVVRIYRTELNSALANPKGYGVNEKNLDELMGLRPGGYTKGHYFRGIL